MATKVATFSPTLAKAIRDYFETESNTRKQPLPNGRGRINTKQKVFARITGNITSGGIKAHSWVEARWNYGTKAFEDAPDGRFGTTEHNYCFKFPDPSDAIDNNEYVELTKIEDPETGANCWVAFGQGSGGGEIPPGNYAHMVYSTLATNVSGWDFPRLHEEF